MQRFSALTSIYTSLVHGSVLNTLSQLVIYSFDRVLHLGQQSWLTQWYTLFSNIFGPISPQNFDVTVRQWPCDLPDVFLMWSRSLDPVGRLAWPVTQKWPHEYLRARALSGLRLPEQQSAWHPRCAALSLSRQYPTITADTLPFRARLIDHCARGTRKAVQCVIASKPRT